MATKLIKFTVQGFRNFRDPIDIDFSDVHDYAFNKECISDGIIMKMGIYGNNGEGKSNLGFALFDIVKLLTDKNVDPAAISPNTFLNVDGKTTEARFSYMFKRSDNVITFSYSKSAETVLTSETLAVNGTTIYSYDYLEKKFSEENLKMINVPTLNFEYLQSSLSILRYIANNTVQDESSPVKAIMDFVSHMLWFRYIPNNGYIGLETSLQNLDEWIIDNGYVKDFSNFLKSVCNLEMDISVASVKDVSGKKDLLVEKHSNGLLLFSLVASNGTKAAELFYFWSKRFQNVSLLFMDEFDAYFHHTMALAIIKELKEFKDMQAIFTTHNTTLMGNEILRPDCYMILSKGKLKSFIDSANGREIREGHNLEKIYRGGGLDG